MTERNWNLLTRFVSAITLLPVVLYLLYRGGGWTGVLLAAAAGMGAAEYFQITLHSTTTQRTTAQRATVATVFGVAAAALLPLLPWLSPANAQAAVVWLIGGTFLFAWAYHLVVGPLADAPTRSAHLVSGVLYAGLGMSALAWMRNEPDGLWWLICTLVITWGNDTSAYFAGRFFGRHRLYEAVSPNKTWEGYAGGMFGSIVGLFVVKGFFFPSLTTIDCVLLGVLGGTFGPMGDLCESMLKRAYGVKDSGRFMPGHGGMLDRIDALLFNAPVALFYVKWLRELW